MAKAAQTQTTPMMNQRSDLPTVMMHLAMKVRGVYIAIRENQSRGYESASALE
jgi:hypothetical protein